MVHQHIKAVFRVERGCAESKRVFFDFGVDLPIVIQHSHFETFLDILYFPHEFTHLWENPADSFILPLLCMSDYFGVVELRAKAIKRAEMLLRDDSILEHSSWYGDLYRFAERSSIDKLKKEVERLCYRVDYLDFRRIWQRIPTPELKRTLFRGLRRIMNADPGDKHKMYIIRYVFENDPELIDVPLFYRTFLYFFKESPKLGTASDAILYLKHEQRLGLDAPETDALTYLQEECVRALNESKEDEKEIMKPLMQLKPGIARAVSFKNLDN